MSRRTSEANKAIALAWENEQQLVREGKGTRDWTQEQQRAILERGKAYDDDGRAFDGQHMRSASAHPESQGDPNNIQFLTRDEHFDAHDRSWQNPTNWYYDPVFKKKTDFGDGPIIPCPVVKLTSPIIEIQINDNVSIVDKETKPEFIELGKHSENDPPKVIEQLQKNLDTPKAINPVPNRSFWVGMKKSAKVIRDFVADHKEQIVFFASAAFGVVAANSKSSSSKKTSVGNATQNSRTISASEMVSGIVSSGISSGGTHASPGEHIVSSHVQHYHTKNGIIMKKKSSYPRGGKK